MVSNGISEETLFPSPFVFVQDATTKYLRLGGL